ncbi:MAG: DUF732 domain-containing protein [Mycolicibacterium sp.]|nr:DUF732 domain-containing protein [Mycolicibacterium sp.]
MITRRLVQVVSSALVAGAALGAGLTAAAPAWADVTPQDQQFLDVVKQLEVPVNSDEDAIKIGREVCQSMDAGRVEPVRTVRGLVTGLQNQGLDKGKAANLVRGAVATYCPQYGSLVGR